jgi:phosphotransferase system IIB component
VVGTRADDIASRIRKVTDRGTAAPRTATRQASGLSGRSTIALPFERAADLIAALGGADNIEQMELFGTRLSIVLRIPDRADDVRAVDTGIRAIARLPDRRVHLLASGDAAAIERAIRKELDSDLR